MSNEIKQVQHDEYHELTLGERIGYGMGILHKTLSLGLLVAF